ncbi:probable G protein-coupled receptor 85 [Ylistrum balloti]|uniref:probable G protein-coupled receptor 85 n=1 Tax=Ylistrum balloti TaxID=509963 RepID=UPI0029059BC9|nr:probable G protein-coupled receptor 85 [Ylistrum balloti]
MNSSVIYAVNSTISEITQDTVKTYKAMVPQSSLGSSITLKEESGMKSETVIKVVVLSIIIVMGIFGNVMVIYSVVSNKRFHKPPFYYLISQSISDLSRAVFCLPFVLASVAQGSVWRHGDSACTLLAFANTFFVFSSAVSLMAIVVDRHLAIVYSHFHRRRSQGLLNLAIVILGWLVSFAVSFPPVFGMGTYRYIPEESQCAFKHKRYRMNDTLGFVLVFSGVIVATMFLYVRIFIFLRDHRKMRPLFREPPRSNNWTFFGPGANAQVVINWLNGMPVGPPAQMPTITQNLNQTTGRVVNLRTRKNEHLCRTFFIVTVAMYSLWIPYLLQAYISIFGKEKSISSLYVTISAWLTYSQVGISPFVYIFSNSSFKRRRDLKSSNNSNYGHEAIPLE